MQTLKKMLVLIGIGLAMILVAGVSTPIFATDAPGQRSATEQSQISKTYKLNLPMVVRGSGSPLPGPTTMPVGIPTAIPTAVPTLVPPGGSPPPPPPANDPVILATGDSRTGCDAGGTAVAKLLDTLPTSWPILFNGDATGTGAYSEFTNCFNSTYGRHKAQLKPVPGNHEYMTSGASGYYQYYGTQAGASGKGYYSFDVGSWHVANLNSEIDISSSSAQVAWLDADLSNSSAKCTIAMWHRPRFSSGEHGNNTDTGAMFQVLYNHNVELLLSGHDHEYERFAPQNPSGAADSTKGIRQFVLGTGGVALRPWATIRANSQFRNNSTWGVVKFTLHPDSYDWTFLPVAGQSLNDSGTTACH